MRRFDGAMLEALFGILGRCRIDRREADAMVAEHRAAVIGQVFQNLRGNAAGVGDARPVVAIPPTALTNWFVTNHRQLPAALCSRGTAFPGDLPALEACGRYAPS